MCTTTTNVTISDVRQLANKYMSTTFTYRGKEYNMLELGWRFEFGTKRRALGTCKMSSKIIVLSKWMIENSENGMATWNNTILHEIAHAIDFEIRGTSKHDWQWRSIALAIGCNGERCSSVTHKENVKSKYTIKCNSCGYERVGHKRSKRVEQGRLSCGKCYKTNGGVFSEAIVLQQIQNY